MAEWTIAPVLNPAPRRRVGRVAYGAGLENQLSRKTRAGSNPAPSALVRGEPLPLGRAPLPLLIICILKITQYNRDVVEQYKQKYPARMAFPSGKQRAFIIQVQERLKWQNIRLAEFCRVSVRTLTDWKREKFFIPLNIVKELSKKLDREIPHEAKIKNPFWYSIKGAKLGGLATIKKYGYIGGDPEVRKKKWFEWWQARRQV